MVFPPPTKTQLTVDDVIAAGACEEGVREWRDENAPMKTSFSVAACLRVSNKTDSDWIRLAAGHRGYGGGYGDGSGPFFVEE